MDRLRQLARSFKDYRKLIKIEAVIMIIIAAVLFYGLKGESQIIRIDQGGEGTASAEEQARSEEPAEPLYVDIGGEVKSPGVYKMRRGSRVFEVIEKAGGLTKHADTTTLNQAEEVTDGQKLWIPSDRDDPVPGTSAEAGSTASAGTDSEGKININTADADTLQNIPGIGPVTAQKIIDYRSANGNFDSIEEITSVSGIGEKTFAKMKDHITV